MAAGTRISATTRLRPRRRRGARGAEAIPPSSAPCVRVTSRMSSSFRRARRSGDSSSSRGAGARARRASMSLRSIKTPSPPGAGTRAFVPFIPSNQRGFRQKPPKTAPRTRKPRPNGSRRNPERQRCLVVGEPLPDAEDEEVLIALGEQLEQVERLFCPLLLIEVVSDIVGE